MFKFVQSPCYTPETNVTTMSITLKFLKKKVQINKCVSLQTEAAVSTSEEKCSKESIKLPLFMKLLHFIMTLYL